MRREVQGPADNQERASTNFARAADRAGTSAMVNAFRDRAALRGAHEYSTYRADAR